MTDFTGSEYSVSELAGCQISNLLVVRFAGSAPDDVDILLMQIEGRKTLHHIFLDGAGQAHWCEGLSADIENSIDEDAEIAEAPFRELWRRQLLSAEVKRLSIDTEKLASVELNFDGGSQIILIYRDSNCSAATLKRMNPRANQ